MRRNRGPLSQGESRDSPRGDHEATPGDIHAKGTNRTIQIDEEPPIERRRSTMKSKSEIVDKDGGDR